MTEPASTANSNNINNINNNSITSSSSSRQNTQPQPPSVPPPPSSSSMQGSSLRPRHPHPYTERGHSANSFENPFATPSTRQSSISHASSNSSAIAKTTTTTGIETGTNTDIVGVGVGVSVGSGGIGIGVVHREYSRMSSVRSKLLSILDRGFSISSNNMNNKNDNNSNPSLSTSAREKDKDRDSTSQQILESRIMSNVNFCDDPLEDEPGMGNDGGGGVTFETEVCYDNGKVPAGKSAKVYVDQSVQTENPSKNFAYGIDRYSGFSDGFLFFSQLRAILVKNILLNARNWPTTLLITVIAPTVIMLLLFALQQFDYDNQRREIHNPASYPLSGVYKCQGMHERNGCITIMYSPPSKEFLRGGMFTENLYRGFMESFAEKNAERTGEDVFIIEDPVTDISFTPTRPMGIIPIPNAEFFYEYILAHPNTTAWGITFDNSDKIIMNIQYQVWYNASRISNGSDWFGSGELAGLVRGLDEAIITKLDNPNVTVGANINITLKDWPLVPASTLVDNVIQSVGPVFVFCSTVLIFMNVLNQILNERDTKLRTSLDIVGLMPSVYWLSNTVSFGILTLISTTITVILGRLLSISVFHYTDISVLIVSLFLFGASMNSLAFCVTTCTRRTHLAITIGMFVLTVGLVFETLVFSSTQTGYIWWRTGVDDSLYHALLLLPFFNFGKLLLDIFTLSAQFQQTGFEQANNSTSSIVTWSSLGSKIPDNLLPKYSDETLPDVPEPIWSIYYMLVNLAFYSTLTWYFDNIVPTELGYRRSLLFFLHSEYWLGPSALGDDTDKSDWFIRESPNSLFTSLNGDTDLLVMEEKLQSFDPCHNGAGKSTLMNILSGQMHPTSGDAIMYGLSIRRHRDAAKHILGLCSQHDMLVDELTAREHIFLFAGLRGVPKEEWGKLCKMLLGSLKLGHVAGRPVKQFSGGMKRRLSLAISSIGDPKVILLDEPSTGMDPITRRHVWSFIQRLKRGRVIIMTTHNMEEADMLADRIGVVANGQLRAIGTPATLKMKYGEGYAVTMCIETGNAEPLKKLIAQHKPSAILQSEAEHYLTYRVPNSEGNDLPGFVDLLASSSFRHLISSWQVSDTSLEEIFLRLTQQSKSESAAVATALATGSNSETSGPSGPSFLPFFKSLTPTELRRRFNEGKHPIELS
ncbi:ATP-binding cassette sub- A member 1 [Blyttiomyces sp. JEL0837]|nr:ATP-binding cassette sub- A member 1 [Blyttiomyces sp. JEL0837]